MGDKFKADIENFGLAMSSQMMLNSLNVMPVFKREKDDDFELMRKKLNEESGIVIANHPGDFDMLCMLATLDRTDIKFMVGEGVYEMWSSIFGEERVVPALRVDSSKEEKKRSCQETEESKREKTAEETELENQKNKKDAEAIYGNIRIVRSILRHIKNGGLFIYFPAGGNGGRHLKKFVFEDLFRVLVEKMCPENMIYSFNIKSDEKKGSRAEKIMRSAGAFSEAGTKGKINVNRFTNPLEIELDEDYSQVSEWQNLLSGEKAEDNRVLTEHYLDKFKIFRKKIEQVKSTE